MWPRGLRRAKSISRGSTRMALSCRPAKSKLRERAVCAPACLPWAPRTVPRSWPGRTRRFWVGSSTTPKAIRRANPAWNPARAMGRRGWCGPMVVSSSFLSFGDLMKTFTCHSTKAWVETANEPCPGSAGILPAVLGKTRLAGKDAGTPRFMAPTHVRILQVSATHEPSRTEAAKLVTGHWSLVIDHLGGDTARRRLRQSPITSDKLPVTSEAPLVQGPTPPVRGRRSQALLLFCFLTFSLVAAAESNRVALVRTPDRGIQPHAAVDEQGVVHLIYYKGDPGGGDVFYVRQEPGQNTFSKPLPVNSQPESAMAAGTIRGAQLALGKGGRVHLVWNGGNGAARVTVDGQHVTPLLYTRLNDAGTGFEPERN